MYRYLCPTDINVITIIIITLFYYLKVIYHLNIYFIYIKIITSKIRVPTMLILAVENKTLC